MRNIVKITLFALLISFFALSSCTNQNVQENKTYNNVENEAKANIPEQKTDKENIQEFVESPPTKAPVEEPIPQEIKSEKEIWIDEQLNNLTLEQKIGQLFICAFRKNENGENILEINNQIEEAIKEYYIGGVIFFSENIETLSQTQKLVTEIKLISEIPPFISIDEEGGRVSRMSGKTDGATIPTAKSIGEANDIDYTTKIAESLGKNLYDIGFNMDFAPVADIFTNPENKVIGDRAFGTEPVVVMENVAAMVRGIQQQNIMSVIKHFPGHGDTKADTHSGQVVSENSLERLRSIELLPFAKGIRENCTGIMVSHITMLKIDEKNPATFSKEIVTGLIRDELKYEGLIITDSLSMGAITNYYTSAEAAVAAFNAGADILLMPQNYKEAFTALKGEIESDKIGIARIDESLYRIFSAKYDYLLAKD